MIAIRISGKDPRLTAEHARALGTSSHDMLAEDRPFYGLVKVMGPIEAPLSKIANHHRWQLLANSPETAVLQQFVHELILDKRTIPADRQVKVSVDVDPVFLM